MFLVLKDQFASVRGIDIPSELIKALAEGPEKLRSGTWQVTVIGYYDDGVILMEKITGSQPFLPQRIHGPTGAAEKMLPFPRQRSPGFTGWRSQTLMNVYGIKPGKTCLMVGAGNIGLIVSLQLLQAGVEVAAIIESCSPYRRI